MQCKVAKILGAKHIFLVAIIKNFGRLAEWFIATVLKTVGSE